MGLTKKQEKKMKDAVLVGATVRAAKEVVDVAVPVAKKVIKKVKKIVKKIRSKKKDNAPKYRTTDTKYKQGE